MTLRDYFAAKAMQAFCSDARVLAAVSKGPQGAQTTCDAAYELADAMLRAREAA